MKPTADYVMLEPRPDASGFIIRPPGVAGRDQSFRARVLAVGPLVDGIAAGDEVVVRRPEGELEELEVLFVRVERVLAAIGSCSAPIAVKGKVG